MKGRELGPRPKSDQRIVVRLWSRRGAARRPLHWAWTSGPSSTGLILIRWSYSFWSRYVWSRSKVDAILLAWSWSWFDGELLPGCTPNLSAFCRSGLIYPCVLFTRPLMAHSPFAIEDGQALRESKLNCFDWSFILMIIHMTSDVDWTALTADDEGPIEITLVQSLVYALTAQALGMLMGDERWCLDCTLLAGGLRRRRRHFPSKGTLCTGGRLMRPPWGLITIFCRLKWKISST